MEIDLLVLGAVLCVGAGAALGMVLESRRRARDELRYIEHKHIDPCGSDTDERVVELERVLSALERGR